MIGLAVVLAISLAVAPLVAEAQQANQVRRIGVLMNNAENDPLRFDAIGRQLAAEQPSVDKTTRAGQGTPRSPSQTASAGRFSLIVERPEPDYPPVDRLRRAHSTYSLPSGVTAQRRGGAEVPSTGPLCRPCALSRLHAGGWCSGKASTRLHRRAGSVPEVNQ